MASVIYDPWDDNREHLKSFPDHILLDIARNDAAELRYRLLAVELLQRMKSPRANHEDIRHLVRELDIEMEGVQTEFEFPITNVPAGPLSCSVTTATLYGEEKVEIPENGQDDSCISSQARDDNSERLGDVPGEQKPAARRPRKTGRTEVS